MSPFTYSFNKYLLSVYFMPHHASGSGDKTVNKTDVETALMEPPAYGREQQVNDKMI